VEVDGKPSSCREIVQDALQVSHMLWNSTDDDEGVIGVLEDRARKVVHQGVEKNAAREAWSSIC
jgi:hypothetical protein